MKKLLLLLPVVALLLTGCWVTTTDGEHTGFVTAVEKNGAFWKTGRVYIKSDLSSSQEDIYCVSAKTQAGIGTLVNDIGNLLL